MEIIKEIQSLIFQEQGLKTSVKLHKTGSMRGYATVSLKKVGGKFIEMPIELSRRIGEQFEQLEPTPTFANKYQVSYFVGVNAIWNN